MVKRAARLASCVPAESSATIVHGDYRLDNCVMNDRGDVIAVLEKEGVDKFVASWNELLDTVRGQLDQAQSSQ